MTPPLALIFFGLGLIYVGFKGYDAGRFFFHGDTVPAGSGAAAATSTTTTTSATPTTRTVTHVTATGP